MAIIVGVHGIGQQVKGPRTLRQEWAPALLDGLELSGCEMDELSEEILECAFYGNLFRRPGAKSGNAGRVTVPEAEEEAFVRALYEGAIDQGLVGDPMSAGPATPSTSIMRRKLGSWL